MKVFVHGWQLKINHMKILCSLKKYYLAETLYKQKRSPQNPFRSLIESRHALRVQDLGILGFNQGSRHAKPDPDTLRRRIAPTEGQARTVPFGILVSIPSDQTVQEPEQGLIQTRFACSGSWWQVSGSVPVPVSGQVPSCPKPWNGK